MKELHIIDTTEAKSTEEAAKMIFLSGAEAMHNIICTMFKDMARDLNVPEALALKFAIESAKDDFLRAAGRSFICEKKGDS